MNYDKMVKALRYCSRSEVIACRQCEYYGKEWPIGCEEALMHDAADAIEELTKNLNMASQELSWTISYAMHLMRDIDELHDMVNEVYYDEL